MWLAILAGACMMFQDTLSALKFQAITRNHGFTAAIIDVFLWGVTITGTIIAAFSLHGNNFREKVLVVIFVTMGTLIGNVGGTRVGKKFVKDTENISQDARITLLEQAVENITIGGHVETKGNG